MSLSVADIYENYLESLQNLPSEIDQNMHELRRMDDDLSKFRETYARHKKAYTKQSKLLENTNTANMISARLQLEKDYKTAMQKQEQKIELANRMYELVSRHIERLDSQVMTSSTLNKADWIKKAGPHQRTKRLDHHTNNGGIRKRIHHSSRPNPTLAAYHGGGGGGGGGLNGMSSSAADMIDPNEPTYCYCNQVSFGDMIACDGENCEREWFHYSCVGLVEPPAGKWFCEDCSKMDRYSAEEDEGGDSSS